MSLELHDGALQIFDVDHGQCALLTMPSFGHVFRVLIDCGHSVNFNGKPWYPGEHLSQIGVDYIDVLICSNYDEDHMSGYPDLVKRNIKIGCILGNPTVSGEVIASLKTEDGMGPGIHKLASTLIARKSINWEQVPPLIPGVHLTWMWNPYPYFEDENNLSLMTLLDIKGYRFLFPGDMERRGWNHMLETYPPFRQMVSDVDVLIAAHHGRKSGICEDIFDVYSCKPNLVVISDDYKQYNTQETTNYYANKSKGITGFRNSLGKRYVLTTRSDGEIIFSFQNGACYVS